jgi:predicted nucleic acid-binding protein
MVRVCFDTNVIVAGILTDHQMHSVCRPWLNRAKNQEFQALLSVHSLAEVYSVITRLPKPYRVSAEVAQRLMVDNLAGFERVELTGADYELVLADVVRLGITSGGIFDALIARAAIVGRADSLLTFNAKDFVRLGESIAALIQIPE